MALGATPAVGTSQGVEAARDPQPLGSYSEKPGPMDITQPVASLAQLATATRASVNRGPPWTQPFHPEVRGANVEISADGYTASRTCGCRQAAVIGGGPLEPQAHGRYFEV